MPKATTPTSGRRRGLEEEYLVGSGLLKNRPSKSKSKSKGDSDDERENNFVDARASRKILNIGRQLAEEDAPTRRTEPTTTPSAFGFDSRYDDGEPAGGEDEDEIWADDDDDEVMEHVDVDPEDLQTFQQFLPSEFDDPLLTEGPWATTTQPPPDEGQGTSTNLADLILARIAAHEAGEDNRSEAGPDDDFELSPKWEDIIELTKPENWTPNAVLAATKLWISHKPAVAKPFLNMILLEHVCNDIAETKKLNVHLFDALRKALYRPAAFFTAVLFPLVERGATLRQAHIISGVLSRVSIPVLHSGAALKGLCDIAAREASAGTEGGGATNVFIKTLLDKRYALPWQVVDALVFHFLRFRNTDPASVTEADAMNMGERAATQAKLPVIWHQTLLSFAIRYKNEITEDQRELLLDLLLTHGHYKIGPEIRRELLAGRGRGVVAEPEGPTLDGDDTMLID
ncbi:Bystin-domain-containing protein [Nemania serpens]|nr:Bystin-domain-containing protein [Nemania serpens]